MSYCPYGFAGGESVWETGAGEGSGAGDGVGSGVGAGVGSGVGAGVGATEESGGVVLSPATLPPVSVGVEEVPPPEPDPEPESIIVPCPEGWVTTTIA